MYHFLCKDRAASPRWTTTDVPLRQNFDRGHEDNASETSSLGNNSSGSLHRSPSTSSTASSGSGSTKQQPRVHKIPIVIEGQPQKAPSPSYNSPNGRSSGYESAHDPARNGDHLSGSPDSRGRHSASPRVSRTQSPVCNGSPREVPVLVEGMPKVKSAMGMGQSTRTKTPRGSEEPATGNRTGPYVTRVNVNSDEGNGDCSPKPSPAKPDPMQIIADVVSEVEKYEQEINEFSGDSSDKQYRYLDEMLTRIMIKLDNVETDGQPEIRAARKEAVNKVHRCVGVLEKRSNQRNGESGTEPHDASNEEADPRTVEENSESLSANNTSLTAAELQSNEVSASPPPPTLIGTETAV